MSNSTSALIWRCWQRIRFPVLLVSMAIIGLTTLMIVYFNPGQGPQAELNTILVCAGIGVFILTPMCSSAVAGSTINPSGVGFPLRAEFAFPVSNLRLTLVPFLFVAAVCYAVFLGTSALLTTVFSHSLPHPYIHFMVLQYLLIVIALSWGSTNIWESFTLWIGLVLMFFSGWLLPDFHFDSPSGNFVAGGLGSLFVPTLTVAGALLLMVLGLRRQRTGDSLLFTVSEPKKHPLFTPLTLRIFRSSCPTHSGTAAWTWYQRQFRGPLAGAGLGLVTGTVVVLVLMFLDIRGFGDEPFDLEAVSGFAFIAFCSVFVAHLATVFGVNYIGGVAHTGTFERTLPISTERIVRVRVGMAMLCLLIAAMTMMLAIALLGSLLLQDFAVVRAEFLQQLGEVTARGIVYSLLRLVLFLCFAYILAMLYSVFITWFAIKPRLMTRAFAALSIYLLLQLAYLVATTEGSEFVAATQALGRAHSWLIAAAIVLGTGYLLSGLLRGGVLHGFQAFGLVTVGLLLLVMNSLDLTVYGGLEEGASLAKTVLQHSLGLLPLAATALALWTQDQLRHG